MDNKIKEKLYDSELDDETEKEYQEVEETETSVSLIEKDTITETSENKPDEYYYKDFENFMKTCIPKNDEEKKKTNVARLTNPTIYYYIPKEKYPEFIDKYYNVFATNNFKINSKYILNIFEKNCEKKSYNCDLDFGYEEETSERIYKPVINKVITLLHNIIVDNFKVKETEIYLLEKKQPTKRIKKDKIEYKDGVHIQICHPFTSIQREYIYSELIKRAKEEDIFKEIPITDKDEETNEIKYDKIFDHSTVNVNLWPLIGSTKTFKINGIENPFCQTMLDINNKSYNVEVGYGYELSQTYINGELTENPDNEELVDLLTMRRFELEGTSFIKIKDDKKEKFNIFEKSLKKTTNNTSTKTSRRDINNKTNENIYTYNETETDHKKIMEAVEYIKMFDLKRFDEYDYWTRFIWACKSIHPNMFNYVIEYSKKSSKYDYNKCKEIWDNAKCGPGNCTIGTLKWWAMQDNPKAFKEYIYKDVDLIHKLIEYKNKENIANLIYPKLSNYTVSGCGKTRTWYKYENHRWVKDDNLHDVIRTIHECADIILKEGERLKKELRNKKQEECQNIICKSESESCNTNMNEIKAIEMNYNKEIKKITDKYKKMYNELMDIQTIDDKVIMAVSNKLLYVDENKGQRVDENNKIKNNDTTYLESLFDTNAKLLGFTNGVYNIENWKLRDGMPSDYITSTTHYDFLQFSDDEKYVKMVLDYFSSFQPNENIKNFLIDIHANCLFEGNDKQKFYIGLGPGGNGKSLMSELMSYVFGDYYNTIDTTLLTQKNKSTSLASPETLSLKNKRITYMNETDKDDRLQLGKMKQFTGNDDIVARNLYSNSIIRFKNLSTIFMLTNKEPWIESDDDGTWRRIMVIPFKNKFVNELPDKKQIEEAKKFGIHYSLIDNDIKDKIKDIRFIQATMWILINRYRKIKKDGNIIIPEEIKNATNDYRRNSNFNAMFIEDNCIKIPEEKEFYKNILDRYNKFIKDNKFKASAKDLEEYLKVNGYEPKTIKEGRTIKKYVFGLKLADEYEEPDELSALDSLTNDK